MGRKTPVQAERLLEILIAAETPLSVTEIRDYFQRDTAYVTRGRIDSLLRALGRNVRREQSAGETRFRAATTAELSELPERIKRSSNC